MAILRGGRRIGNYDIRVGIPRDRSLDNVNADERLRRKPGGNPESTINRFIAEINQGEGLARPNRFLVMINLPKRQVIEADDFDMTPPNNDLESLTTVRNIGMMCNQVTFPNRDINTKPHIMYGPRREMPYAYSYSGQVECTFIADKFLRQRAFFENWQNKVFDEDTHYINYYDNFVGQMDIYQLGQFDVEAEAVVSDGPAGQTRKVPKPQVDNASVTYGVRLFEVYPQTICSYDYTYASENEQVIVPVTLNFRTWTNLTIDQIDGATIGKSRGDVPTIKASKDFGLFGGLLSKLPNELKRAGRDILQTTRRNLPIGRVTGGRLFPPFG